MHKDNFNQKEVKSTNLDTGGHNPMASKCSRLDFHKLQHPDDELVLTDDRYNQFVTSISSGMTLKSFARTAFNFTCLSLQANPNCGSNL